jgi:hypothetical protein
VKTIRQVDWKTYDEVFPDRYLDPSIFDKKVDDSFWVKCYFMLKPIAGMTRRRETAPFP